MSHLRATVRRIGRVVLYGFAAVYFIIDLAFLSFIRPLRRRLLGSGRLLAWIEGLNRYVALALVLVPLAILEPVKPVGFYLTAKGHVLSGGAVLVLGEIIKVTLVEQVIEIAKPKLMSFRWFAWAYRPLGGCDGPATLDRGMAGGPTAVPQHRRAGATDQSADGDP